MNIVERIFRSFVNRHAYSYGEKRRNTKFNSLKSLGIKFFSRNIKIDNVEFNMLLSAEDSGLSKELISNNLREEFFAKHVKKCLMPEDIVIDIGTNFGFYMCLEGKIAKKVYGIEPVSYNYKMAGINITLNNLSNVFLYNCAISDKKGFAKIYVPDQKNWSTLNKDHLLKSKSNFEEFEVETLSIKDFIVEHMQEEKPTFIRMDIEGYEYELLKNVEYLSNFSDLKLAIELHGNILQLDKSLEILNNLKRFGWQLLYSTRDIETWMYEIPEILKPTIIRNYYKLADLSHGLLPFHSIDNIINYFKNKKPFCIGIILKKA